jgi:hypothetical protein
MRELRLGRAAAALLIGIGPISAAGAAESGPFRPFAALFDSPSGQHSASRTATRRPRHAALPAKTASGRRKPGLPPSSAHTEHASGRAVAARSGPDRPIGHPPAAVAAPQPKPTTAAIGGKSLSPLPPAGNEPQPRETLADAALLFSATPLADSPPASLGGGAGHALAPPSLVKATAVPSPPVLPPSPVPSATPGTALAFAPLPVPHLADIPFPRSRPSGPARLPVSLPGPAELLPGIAGKDPACVNLLEAGIEASVHEPILGPGQCGATNPVRVAAFHLADGTRIPLEPEAILRCPTARAIASWVRGSVAPQARAEFGSGLTALRVAGSYECRPRNRVAGAIMSEHGKANALDIGAFRLADGRWIEVGHGGKDGDFVQTVRVAACGYVKTVLGPGSADGAHESHLHLDLAVRGPHGDGRYCH